MNQGILFALLSLISAGINDVVFKKYSKKDRSRGVYIFGIGIIWTALQTAFLKLNGPPLFFSSNSIGYGLAAGIFLTFSNILLIESFTYIDVSLGSTIYRLNTIGVVVLSFFFLHEPMGLLKSIGILSGDMAVSFLYQKSGYSHHYQKLFLFFLLAVLASCFRAMYGVSTKSGILSGADPQAMLLIISSCWILGGVCYAVFFEKRFNITVKKVLYSILSGVLVYFIANFLMLAVTYGQASIVIPIANMSFIVALSLSIGMSMERFTRMKGIAIILAGISILLLSYA